MDLGKRFITVKTAKTGHTVDIPIFPLLFDELKKAVPQGVSKPDGHVFPKQSKMYDENPDGITLRVRAVFAQAGFRDAPEQVDGGELIVDSQNGNGHLAPALSPKGGEGDAKKDGIIEAEVVEETKPVVHRRGDSCGAEGWAAAGVGAGFP